MSFPLADASIDRHGEPLLKAFFAASTALSTSAFIKQKERKN